MNKFKGALAVFCGAASFGILSTFVKKSYAAGFNLGEVTGVQAFFGMVLLWSIYLILHLRPNSKALVYTKKTPAWKIIIAGFSTGIVSILYYKCVQLVPASIAIVLLMQFIWISALLNLILYKQKPTSRQTIGIVAILFATIFATGALESSIENISLVGIGFGFLAALAYSVFIMVNGKMGNDYPPIQKSALMVTGASILIFSTLQPFSLFQLDSTNPLIYQYGLLLAVFGTVLPPFLFAYGMPKIDIALGGILSAVELPVAVAMSFFVLQESVSWMQWMGVALILLIVIWINSNKKQILNP